MRCKDERRQCATSSPRWLYARWANVTIPSFGRDLLSRTSSTSLSIRSVSPTKIGAGKRTSSHPRLATAVPCVVSLTEIPTISPSVKHELTRIRPYSVPFMYSASRCSGAGYMKGTEYGRILVNSCFTLGLMVGISVNDTTQGTAVAYLGWDEVRFPAPIFVGDTLRIESEVLEVQESRSRPAQGIVTFAHRAYNQHGELVAHCRRSSLQRKRPTDKG